MSMLAALSSLLVLVCTAVLTVFGLHRARLACVPRRASAIGTLPDTLPSVTVQLPLFNEEHVAVRLIDAACALHWPRALLQVQVVDDSTDVTRALVDAAVARGRTAGVDVTVVRRADRAGYKAGALAHATAVSRGSLIAIFDADFLPAPDFLSRMVPSFADAAVGMVQARWGHQNADASLLTRAQALLLDAHFSVEQAGRSALSRWFNFNGTAGIWRRSCIDDAGGWQGDTLSEDVDLSYRAQLRAWRFVYRDDVVVPAELPACMGAFVAQQQRWMSGLLQVARKLLPTIWRSQATLAVRIEATLHLLAPVAVLCTVALVVALACATALGAHVRIGAGVLSVGSLGVLAFYAAALSRRTQPQWRSLVAVPAVFALGIGIAPATLWACWRALLARRALPFERTPKHGAQRHTTSVRARALLPIALGVGAGACAVVARCRHASSEIAVAFVVLFALGLLWVGSDDAWARAAYVIAAARKRARSGRSTVNNTTIATGTLKAPANSAGSG